MIRMLFKKENLRSAHIAACVTFIAGVAVHFFALTNVIHNYDDIASYPIGFGTGLSSGRWFLEILNFLSIRTGRGFNLTYLNGLLFIFLIAVAAFFLCSALKLKNIWLASLAGICFVVFPTAVSIMLFRFTAHIYALAILFSVLAVYVVGRFRFSFLVSAALMALSLGVYQGYFPITVSLFVLMLIRQILEDTGSSGKKHLFTGLYYCALILLGIIFYLASLKVCLSAFNSALSSYQGIGNTYSYDFTKLPSLLYQALSSFLLLPFRDYCDIADVSSIRRAYLLIELFSLVLLALCYFKNKPSLGKTLVLLCAGICFPFAVNFIVLIAPDMELYTMVVYSFVALLWFPIMLMDILGPTDRKFIKVTKLISALLISFVALSYSYYANSNYSTMYFASRQTENYMNALVTQIRMTEDFTPDKRWAFVGELNDPLLEKRWELASRYGGSVTADYLLHCYSNFDWIRVYFGYHVPLASPEELQTVKASEAFLSMPCWPSEGSIRVIDDLVVIKFSEG